MIRAKRLEWEAREWFGPTIRHVSKFGHFEYVVTPCDFNAGFEADLRVGTGCYRRVGKTHPSIDAAKAACQAHADARAREIAEVGDE